ncbi:unnamed protein product [Phaedon cochleariae]|uniref:Uncharacterized protein n=1 Tax=Phaedon cochleariae TaxID=80249 RepID=A0A9N9SD83_PHACE|nr:unnamed protein product [Phaedon cochleariae]
MPENEADFERFLSEEALKYDFESLEVVLSGGFEDESRVESTVKDRDLIHLRATHEKTDTRLVLHTVLADAENVVVSVRDTDVILLSLHYFSKMKCSKVWIMSGTAIDRRFMPIHDVCDRLAPGQVIPCHYWM